MPIKRIDAYSDVTFHVDGVEIHGIPDLDVNFEPATEYIRENISLTQTDAMTFTAKCKINKWIIYKLIGLYSWVMDHCPNKRVVHLAQYAKKSKIRSKNFNRAIRIIAKTYYRY